jgi:tRNA dimethylallyltransferase
MSMNELDDRIAARVDAMFRSGLVEETAGLLASGVPADAPALRALGYRETAAMLRGAMDLTVCVETVKRNTRRYARRQMTWFRAEKGVRWLDATGRSQAEVADMVMDTYFADERRTTEA